MEQRVTIFEDSESFQPYRSLYLHIPFCKKRCKYCDFPTKALANDSCEMDEYLLFMIEQIRKASRAGILGSIETVYIGGGTPTHFGNKRLSNLLYTLSLSMHLTPEVECTLEVNPESLTESMVKDLFALGVTRLSMGVQSFDDEVLKAIGRIHDSATAQNAVKMAKDRFDNVSIDLMCGLPRQSKDSFRSSLETALNLGVNHISIYPLILEEGTPLFEEWDKGLISLDEDAAAEMMELAEQMLTKAGFVRYEVASYAKPGYECKHNTA
ncbi:MAG: radical SAM family heme chaperone HemW [Anaerotardibacter sp.]